MYFSLYLFFLGLPAFLLITFSGCSKLPEKTYVNHPKILHKQVDIGVSKYGRFTFSN